MKNKFLDFNNVSFAYDTMSRALFNKITFHCSKGWTGIVGANGNGKTTILKLAIGMLRPHEGNIYIPGEAIYCEQRTDFPSDEFNQLINEDDSAAYEIKGRLQINDDWLKRWDTLSHGERKRAQIGVFLWHQPKVLALDEPTNHIDIEAKNMLKIALKTYKGIGLLVSHDRELLDTLCKQCLFVEPPNVIMRPNTYTEGIEEAQKEDEYKWEQFKSAQETYKKLKRTSGMIRDEANKANRKRSKRNIPRKDHDAKEKIDMARLTGKDGAAGKKLRQMQGRIRHTESNMKELQSKLKKIHKTGIWLPGSYSQRNVLFKISEGEISLGNSKKLKFPNLMMQPADRISLIGPNGAGKSTLIRHILENLNIPKKRLTYIPQEIDIKTSRQIIKKIQELSNIKKSHLMATVSRLSSDPYRILESEIPSPGEIRKLLLALGIANEPHIIIMDEPTNHLDLPSIECLEKALSDCPCGLLLVSHDMRFLDNLTHIQWKISKNINNFYILKK